MMMHVFHISDFVRKVRIKRIYAFASKKRAKTHTVYIYLNGVKWNNSILFPSCCIGSLYSCIKTGCSAWPKVTVLFSLAGKITLRGALKPETKNKRRFNRI